MGRAGAWRAPQIAGARHRDSLRRANFVFPLRPRAPPGPPEPVTHPATAHLSSLTSPQSLEKELAKEKSSHAAEAEKATAAAGAAAQLRVVQKEMRARIEAAEKEAKAAKGSAAGLEKKV